MEPIPTTTLEELESRFDALLFDAYGVLVDARGVLPGAVQVLERLRRNGKAHFVVTNDASRLPETMERRFRALGLPLDREIIVSSGDLVDRHVASMGLRGKSAIVLGPPDGHATCRRAGLVPMALSVDARPDAIVICDESGFDLLHDMDIVLSLVVRAVDEGRSPHLLVPNPDLVYPKGDGEWGFAAGTLAAMIERALEQRFSDPPRFVRLGKPYGPIFEEACRRSQTKNCVMIGDQIHTDIAGANRFGLASALLGSGIARLDHTDLHHEDSRPTFVLRGLVA